MINVERVQLFVKELNSGNYKQGFGALAHAHSCLIGNGPFKYCSLGVACEVAIKNGIEIQKFVLNDYCYYDGLRSFLPESVRNWYGFHEPNPVLKFQGNLTDAITINDEQKATFEQIAVAFAETYLNPMPSQIL